MTGRGASFPTYSSPGWRTTHRCGRLGSIYSSYRVYDARTGQHRLCSARNMVHHAHASSQVAALRRVVRAFPVAIPLGCVHAHTVNGTESCARRIGQTLAGRTPFASFGASSSRVRPSSHTAPLRRAGIVWYRNDLRLHDHEAMMRANGGCTSVLPVYCFDPREYQQRARGRYQKTGPYRARFRIDAVTDLRGRLREMGSDLMVVIGKPEEVIPRLANKVGASAVYCHTEVTYEENKVEEAVKRAFTEGSSSSSSSSSSSEFYSFWTNTLHDVDDVPGGADLEGLPKRFDEFKREMEGVEPKRSLGGVGGGLRGLPLGVSQGDMGEIPTLEALGMAPVVNTDDHRVDNLHADSKTMIKTDENNNEKKANSHQATCQGGETEALRQLRTFVESVMGGNTKTVASFSGNIAPWLASGCLSPRRMLEAVLEEGVGEDALRWIKFELLYRDYFKLITKRAAQVQAAVGRSMGRRGCVVHAA